jgi:catechol 2,3-dioxygenase-like lactoylglutathione lyase family enzyme
MLSDAHLIAFVPSTDLDRSRAFYVDVLGLPEHGTTPYACILSAAGVQLRITLVDQLRPQPFTVLGWQVADAGDTARTLERQGVSVVRYQGIDQDADGIWTTPGGDRVAWFRDPDGNTLSVTEFRR